MTQNKLQTKSLTTFDGVRILFHEDGLITNWVGYGFGSGCGRSRTIHGKRLVNTANKILRSIVGFLNYNEIQKASTAIRSSLTNEWAWDGETLNVSILERVEISLHRAGILTKHYHLCSWGHEFLNGEFTLPEHYAQDLYIAKVA